MYSFNYCLSGGHLYSDLPQPGPLHVAIHENPPLTFSVFNT